MTPSPNPAPEKSAYNWHILSSITLDGLESPDRYCEVLAAACCDGIGVIARWTRNPDRSWAVEAMDTESIDGMAPVLIFGDDEVVPPEPPIETICNPTPEPAPEKSATPEYIKYAAYAKLSADLAQARAELEQNHTVAEEIIAAREGDIARLHSESNALAANLSQARDTIKALREALEDAIKYQVSNLGYPHQEFYRCITKPFGEMPEWVVTAKQALASTREDAP